MNRKEYIQAYAKEHPGECVRDIAIATGQNASYVYRALSEAGIELPPRPKQVRTTGVVCIAMRSTKDIRRKTRDILCASVPVTTLRAAGLDTAARLRFRAEAGRIVLEREQ